MLLLLCVAGLRWLGLAAVLKQPRALMSLGESSGLIHLARFRWAVGRQWFQSGREHRGTETRRLWTSGDSNAADGLGRMG